MGGRRNERLVPKAQAHVARILGLSDPSLVAFAPATDVAEPAPVEPGRRADDGHQKATAQLLGVSNGSRTDSWQYDDRSRLRGESFCLEEGETTNNLRGWAERISSIDNPDGLEVTVCDRTNLRGDCRTYIEIRSMPSAPRAVELSEMGQVQGGVVVRPFTRRTHREVHRQSFVPKGRVGFPEAVSLRRRPVHVIELLHRHRA